MRTVSLRRRALVAAAILAGLTGSALAASAAPAPVLIPGLQGRGLHVTGAQRTDLGGAIFVTKASARRDARRGPVVVGQLQADGALLLSYGNAGLTGLPVSPRFAPSALAIDPSSGAAWIGGTVGRASEIIALSGSGELVQRFGHHGVLTLPPADAGAVAALAWRPGGLLAAAGDDGACAGCELSRLDPRTGSLRRSVLLPGRAIDGDACDRVQVTSAVLLGAGRALLGTSAQGGAGCSAALVSDDAQLSHPPAASPTPLPPGPVPRRWTQIAAGGRDVCVAYADASGVSALVPGAGSAQRVAAPPGGPLLGLVPLGGGSCAALLAVSGGGATVVQVNDHTGASSVTHLRAGFAAETMFRCRQHLLVLAAQGRSSDRHAFILPVAIAQGPFAAAARAGAASAYAASTGCT